MIVKLTSVKPTFIEYLLCTRNYDSKGPLSSDPSFSLQTSGSQETLFFPPLYQCRFYWKFHECPWFCGCGLLFLKHSFPCSLPGKLLSLKKNLGIIFCMKLSCFLFFSPHIRTPTPTPTLAVHCVTLISLRVSTHTHKHTRTHTHTHRKIIVKPIIIPPRGDHYIWEHFPPIMCVCVCVLVCVHMCRCFNAIRLLILFCNHFLVNIPSSLINMPYLGLGLSGPTWE